MIPVVVAALLVLVAMAMVGPRPRAADAGFPKQPPPLALPSEVAGDAPLALAAARLAAGDLAAARTGFTNVVAEDQDGVAGQVGLVLSRWRSTGPVSVERDLRQLVREYPDSALAVLHLGLVQGLLEDPRGARRSLREAMRLGHEAADPTSLRMARLANDLLHPTAFTGDLPVLVAPGEVSAADRAKVRELLDAVRVGDAKRIADLTATMAGLPGMTGVAVVAAGFDKDDPEVTVDRLEALGDEKARPGPARDRARFMATLAQLWGGGERETGCVGLRASAAAPTDAATRRLARPIAAELCR